MKQFVILIFSIALLPACDNSVDNNSAEDNENVHLEDPAAVHPPEEAVPDSLEIRGDSTIVPE